MTPTALSLAEPLASTPDLRSRGDLWAVVLAGGEGLRMPALIRQLYGVAHPERVAASTGSKSLLRQTLERVTLLVPPERIVVVTHASHVRFLGAELAGLPAVHVLSQPSDRGTAASVLLPAHWIRARDPHAMVAVFPADHFILEESVFMGHVAEVVDYVREHPDWLVLLGAPPTDPDPDYGWIEPGLRLGWAGGGAVHQVGAFREKPSKESACRLFSLGGLWNTFIFIAGVAALIEAGRACVPLLHDRLVRLAVFAGTQFEAWAVRQAYLLAPAADFSRSVLASPLPRLAVARLPSCTWCDMGTAERATRTRSAEPRRGRLE
ncbi:MAG TPA: sugar phosphate nucleotidyltransferase [Methylomirabilota bacterium]|jgi:mannose-1-phosphate guanylyltransferase